jgi:hypothetical protein
VVELVDGTTKEGAREAELSLVKSQLFIMGSGAEGSSLGLGKI